MNFPQYDVGTFYSYNGVYYIAVNVEILPPGTRRGVAKKGKPPQLFTWRNNTWVSEDIPDAKAHNHMSVAEFRRLLGVTSEQLDQLQKKYFEIPKSGRRDEDGPDRSTNYRGDTIKVKLRLSNGKSL